MELDALREAHLSLGNATTWSDKPDIYRPLQEGMGKVCVWLENVSAGPTMMPKEFAAKEMMLSGLKVRR